MSRHSTRKPADLTNKKFNRLTVVRFHGHVGARRVASWWCRCKCGEELAVRATNLTTGHTQSCGCLQQENAGKASRTHGKSRTKEYRCWSGMITRCFNKNEKGYELYGGRGITVCQRWRESFAAFLEDMGPCPDGKRSIDRFPNRDGNYEPGNCRWATDREQCGNRGVCYHNNTLTDGGVTKTYKEWADSLGIKPKAIADRLWRGWTIHQAVATPRQRRPR